MIYGLNLLLWTTEVNETHFPLLDDIRKWGYDAVEIPVFNLDPALHRRVGVHLDGLGLKRSAVTVCSEESTPATPGGLKSWSGPSIRRSASSAAPAPLRKNSPGRGKPCWPSPTMPSRRG